MTNSKLHDVAYHIPWRTSGVRTGAHRSRLTGAGGLFRDLAPFMANPDPRRIAMRSSLADPFERLLVKRSEQTAAVTLQVLIDVSASMGCRGRVDKLQIACEIADALSVCAHRSGDSYGLIVFDDHVREEFLLAKTRSRSAHADVISRLRSFRPANKRAGGIVEAASLVGGGKKLVVVISDFLWSDRELTSGFEALAQHDVLPIEIDDSGWLDGLPEWGILNLQDSESNARRLIVMRPALKQAWQARDRERRRTVAARASGSGRDLFTVHDTVAWDRLSAYLMYGSAP